MIFLANNNSKEIELLKDLTYDELERYSREVYQQGRADAIDELMKTMESWSNNIMEIRGAAPFFTLDNIRDIAEQLKEKIE